MKLEIQVGKALLKTPLIGASGLFGYGTEYGDLIDYGPFGAIVAKTITLSARDGNPPPRIVDAGCGIINSIGLENVGAQTFLKEKLSGFDLPCLLFASIGGQTVEEFARLAGMLDRAQGIAAIEVNISCPNIKKGGIAFGSDAESTHRVIRAVRDATGLTVIPKLPPLVSRIEEVSQAACDGGADALIVANTIPGMAIDISAERPSLGGIWGGYSGKAIKPVQVLLVWKVARATSLPIIGAGGIEDGSDAVEFILAGATAFEIGSVILKDLQAPSRILAGLTHYMEEKGYSSIADFKGKAHRLVEDADAEDQAHTGS